MAVAVVNQAEDRLAEVWSLIDQAQHESKLRRSKALLVRPANGITLTEYCKRYKVVHSTAQHQLDRLRDNGKVEEVLVMLPDTLGRLVATKCYVPVETVEGGKKVPNAPQLRIRRGRGKR